MKYFFPVVILFMLQSTDSVAQYGIDLRYSSNNYSNLNEVNPESLFGNNFEIGIDYWMRLSKYRIELLPQLIYGFKSEKNIIDEIKLKNSFKEYGLRINTHFYVFNFKEDCNCPTFSKQGNFFTKGFYLNLLTGINMQNQKIVVDSLSFSADRDFMRFQVGLGAGMDIGIIDLITLTPFVNYIYSYGKGIGDTTIQAPYNQYLNDNVANATSWQFGIRIGLRFDYKPYRPKKFY